MMNNKKRAVFNSSFIILHSSLFFIVLTARFGIR